ncbi:MAG: LysM peptidoglycan-binding domain-containing protein [Granulosicoccus sp.]
MIRKTSPRVLFLIISTMLVASGCATSTIKPIAVEIPAIEQDTVYEIKPGDTLGTISQRLTGRIDNWKPIAEHNAITDPRTLAVGQVINIPSALTKTATQQVIQVETGQPAALSPTRITTTAASNPEPQISVATGNGVAVVQAKPVPVNDSADITVSPIEVNRTFDLEPLAEPEVLATDDEQPRFDSAAPQIRVSGTYYPKGIYQEPAIYARLIQRAAPGSVFPLESAVNDWYKIVTDEGVGYIRQSDGLLVE